MRRGRRSAASLQAIQANIGEKQAAIDSARAKEGVLTGDISALSKRIRTMTPRDRVAAPARGARRRTRSTRAAHSSSASASATRRSTSGSCGCGAELRRSQGVLAERLIEIYKADQPDMLSVILESDGFNDLLVRADYMSAIGEQDSVIVDTVRDAEAQVGAEAAAARRAEVAAPRWPCRRSRPSSARCEETRAAIQAREADLAAARKYKSGKLGNVREHRHELEGDLRALQAASAQVTNQLQGAGPAPAGPDPPGRRRIHLAGERPGRVARSGSAGAGCTRASTSPCRPARPIRAAASGSVAMAGWMGGYGQYTCIQHGGGVATCYAHQSSIGVGTGASVKQGQVIGSVGCTGHCFGDHLHFEVRINGSPVDPMGYL